MTVVIGLGGTSVCLAETIDFNQDVRPILATHCLACHGPDAEVREAGLRLDEQESAFAELDSGHRAVVPTDPEQSELLRRVLSTDGSERMPPSDLGPRLTDAEIETLRLWIAQGAAFSEHWSFVAPQETPLPDVEYESFVRNPIDRFVFARLEQEGLTPSEEADRYRLCRRVTLDLTGLPPTIKEADEFVHDTRPGAYERLVDRLLTSPRFGERWARVWLDLARYADSQGYAQDDERTIWRYRDWVINAINEGMPFDQFTVEQLAGDLLPDPTNDQLIATAFHRNTMTNSEGGTNNEEFRNAAIVDRVNTTMEVWMGMTMGCAQCHSHKYDPISQEEYFQFFAILNQTQDADRPDESPVLEERSVAQLTEMAKLETQIDLLESKIRDEAAALQQATPEDEIKLPMGALTTKFVRIQSLGEQRFLHLAEVQVFVGEANVATDGVASQSSTDFGGDAKRANDGNTDGDYQASKSVSHTAQQDNPWWEVELKEPATIDRVVLWNRTDNNLHTRLKDWRVILFDENRHPLFVEQFAESPPHDRPIDIPAHSDKLTDSQRETLLAYLKDGEAGLSPEEKQLADLKKQLAEMKPDITTPVMLALAPDQQRVTKIQRRGNFRSLGEEVMPGVPTAFHALEGVDEPTRLDLARWLVDPANPLTARVVVNRYWEQLFGTGIVETSEDFGTQGELPSHPALLDHLAVEVMRHDWDTKWLLREIVTSATYRQSSRTSPELAERDPRNRLLARGPRFRLSAEMIRDQALAVSGQLSDKMLGPSVRPYKPNLGLRAAFGRTTDWDTSPGEDAYRRGLYTKWRRTAPYPSMVTFDAPSREFCTIRRTRTNTPLQALVTLNDPVYIQAAQSLARHVLTETEADEATRINLLFRTVLIRPPSPPEQEQLSKTLASARSHFYADLEAAEQMATDPIASAAEGTNLIELAAWTVLANVVLNLDETLARP
ncbi:MAG: DUF1553 domain-containing protein [Planctomycetaceae bacterium]|nr:DUF1553 domain-containing protein [Planctomycetaceae bacterium]